MSSPVTVAVRLPVVEGVNEKFDAVIVSSAVALLAGKVTVYSRLLSQDWAWVDGHRHIQLVRRFSLPRQREDEVLQPRADASVLRLDGDGGGALDCDEQRKTI